MASLAHFKSLQLMNPFKFIVINTILLSISSESLINFYYWELIGIILLTSIKYLQFMWSILEGAFVHFEVNPADTDKI